MTTDRCIRSSSTLDHVHAGQWGATTSAPKMTRKQIDGVFRPPEEQGVNERLPRAGQHGYYRRELSTASPEERGQTNCRGFKCYR